jgi:hypothetical protein
MTAPWNNPKIVSKTPLLSVALLEIANVSQLRRMWTEGTAEGQSLQGWMCVGLALVLWWNFYRVVTPNEKYARLGTMLGIAMNASVILSVIWFRYL